MRISEATDREATMPECTTHQPHTDSQFNRMSEKENIVWCFVCVCASEWVNECVWTVYVSLAWSSIDLVLVDVLRWRRTEFHSRRYNRMVGRMDGCTVYTEQMVTNGGQRNRFIAANISSSSKPRWKTDWRKTSKEMRKMKKSRMNEEKKLYSGYDHGNRRWYCWLQ